MADRVQNQWLWISREDLEIEWKQLQEEGREVHDVGDEFQRLMERGDEWLWTPDGQRQAEALLDRCCELPRRNDYRYQEPSDLQGIRQLRPEGVRRYADPLPEQAMRDRIEGAWLGRCIGCLLGKAAEGVKSERFWPFLKATSQWPVRDYIRFGADGEVAETFPDVVQRSGYDDVDCMPVDDDTNYTTAGMLIVKTCGADFTPADVGQFWLENLPLVSTCTAERVAYRNLSLHIQPPGSATHRNPYREWIGAQIRADGLAYTAAGQPERAAEFAWRDASISHVGNGIYGEMFVAAMIAAAAHEDDPRAVIEVGLSEIPHTSRLHADVTEAIDWREQGLTYDQAVARIHERWNEHSAHDWCHTNSNAVICTTAMLYGEGDFGLSICRAVQPCFDTDCNGATVGSILGMMLGTDGIANRWSSRLEDTLRTSIRGYDRVSISGIAAETFELYRQIR